MRGVKIRNNVSELCHRRGFAFDEEFGTGLGTESDMNLD
jgi:hypothetical protein